MAWSSLFLILVICTFVLLLSGMWVAVVLGVVGIIGLYVGGSIDLIHVLGNIAWKTTNDATLTAIPLFLLMGEIILNSGLAQSFYKGVGKFTSRIPGGLLHSNIIACGIFSAISGSSVATAAAIGAAAIPEMKTLGYKRNWIYGTVTAGGTLGILIPPSISLIVYGSLTSVSVVRLFKAALIPGITLLLIYMIIIAIINFADKKAFVNVKKEEFDISIGRAFLGILPFAGLIAIVLGGIYLGWTTPTEAAGVGVTVAIIIAKLCGSFGFKQFKEALLSSIMTTSMILFIMIGAQIISYVLTATKISRDLIDWLTGLGLSQLTLILCVCCIYIIMGCFVDGNSMQFMTIPVLFPALMAYGVDPIWFGILLVVLIELGQVTPPLGLNLFVVHGIDKESKLSEIIYGSLPFLMGMIVMVVILLLFPQLATFTVQ